MLSLMVMRPISLAPDAVRGLVSMPRWYWLLGGLCGRWYHRDPASGSSSARLECTVRDREVASSNLAFPTRSLQRAALRPIPPALIVCLALVSVQLNVAAAGAAPLHVASLRVLDAGVHVSRPADVNLTASAATPRGSPTPGSNPGRRTNTPARP